jgi:hypothetical protein
MWTLPVEIDESSTDAANPTPELTWQHPARIHQNSSKVMVSHTVDNDTTLIVSGGDDGSLAFLLAHSTPAASSTSPSTSYVSPPILASRAHASAVTACTIVVHQARIFLLTSGNDEWVRLWEITLNGAESKSTKRYEDVLKIQRLQKIKTNVADVSSMAVLDADEDAADARTLVCGVGMEVVRIQWGVLAS